MVLALLLVALGLVGWWEIVVTVYRGHDGCFGLGMGLLPVARAVRKRSGLVFTRTERVTRSVNRNLLEVIQSAVYIVLEG